MYPRTLSSALILINPCNMGGQVRISVFFLYLRTNAHRMVIVKNSFENKRKLVSVWRLSQRIRWRQGNRGELRKKTK